MSADRAWQRVRFATSIDFALCAALAIPGVASLTLRAIGALGEAAGGPPLPEITGPALFFVNLAGVFGVLWNVVMLRERAERFHHVDLAGRGAVIALVLFHVLGERLPPIFLFIVASELVGGLLKLSWLRGAATATALGPSDGPRT